MSKAKETVRILFNLVRDGEVDEDVVRVDGQTDIGDLRVAIVEHCGLVCGAGELKVFRSLADAKEDSNKVRGEEGMQCK